MDGQRCFPVAGSVLGRDDDRTTRMGKYGRICGRIWGITKISD
jgi:hypothetical protein